MKLYYSVNDDTENSRKVVKECELDVGSSAIMEQEASKIHERHNTPAIQHKNQHCVQKVVTHNKCIHLAESEYTLGHRGIEVKAR